MDERVKAKVKEDMWMRLEEKMKRRGVAKGGRGRCRRWRQNRQHQRDGRLVERDVSGNAEQEIKGTGELIYVLRETYFWALVCSHDSCSLTKSCSTRCRGKGGSLLHCPKSSSFILQRFFLWQRRPAEDKYHDGPQERINKIRGTD